ncbi:MAG: Nicotinamidase/isochorismatase family protein [uncultured Solirubrobacteraceae bacterium]|uniref:Nicotinamidase/isochorismatase family protein n=1 Tax=uncultured Solirubrobacteraceae bacterium TaxID=1162706 RepID=A0A6J4RA54_9ACTN|nr:MAG: Nicotinamidase/isochorismatase family protein [uncultured Solirubrobacteraceae bacterium]
MELHGRTALIVIDVQKGEILPQESGIPIMPGGEERHDRIRAIVAAARDADVPVIFIQEVHKRTLVDFGRELDGSETIHGLEGDLTTELADGLDPRPDEYLIRKRRYSAFFATELELVLKSYGVQTLILLGALTDVCVHYTFADAHQHDYHCRVVTDCVGGSSLPAHEASLKAMQYLQRDALVSSGEVLGTLGELARPLAEAA